MKTDLKHKNSTIDMAFDKYVEEAFPSLEKNMSEFVFSNGSFSLIDLIDYILKKTGKAKIDVSTWVASYASINHIIDFLEDQRINEFRFLMDSGFKNTRRELYDHIDKFFPNSIALTRTHSKFTIIHNDEYNFVIETSANLNKNNRLENFRVTEDKTYCDFFRGVFNDIYSKSINQKGFVKINEVYA